MLQFKNTNFKGKKVVMRVDFNVPLDENFEVTDDTRIVGAIPTITKILHDGGSVVLMSHLGRPKDGPEDRFSLKHITRVLQQYFPNNNLYFASDCISKEAFLMSSNLEPGEILLLENLRFYKEEEKGDVAFAEELSKHGEIYINDAFGTAHREHASTATIARFFDTDHKGFGLLMAAEVENAQKLLNHPDHPVTAIVGGAKVSDKILLLEQLIDNMDNILIGGGMAYTFIKALGGKVGNSLVQEDYLNLALKIIDKAKDCNTSLYLPIDNIVADRFAADANTQEVDCYNIPDGWMGLDIGPQTVNKYSKIIKSSKTILWNGPMGVFEYEKFAWGTFAVAEALAEATDNGAFSLIGGGDSASAINKSGLEDRVSFVSTGGGAMLEFLEGKVLPGIRAIEE
ncbi:MAG: phosphoglycerate kinase [Saprospiraceae bacterium]|nr:MAG: phosphoglycerate kinase [Bacteroidetes bacterium OLB9]MCO6463494.1 phosphoglycerate kinase [Saprospiraceae bacterium]MCZ2338533.1 phosphoglycerate kinase [Chitinophagales bacterium]